MRALVLFAAVVAARPAAADPAPWVVGVTEDQKAKAKVLLDQGNALLLAKDYVAALARYAEAITHWDHPAIRFNMVRCQIFLGKNLEAHADLERALRWGAAPLEDAVYQEALGYQKLLATQIGSIAIDCRQDGVELTLDGQPLARCPVRESHRVLAGPHQIVGRKAGLLPRTIELVVVGGKTHHAAVTLDPLAKAARVVHRWPTYVPWTVFGGGFALGGAGGLFVLLAHDQMESYDAIIRVRCTGNCTPADLADVDHLRTSADRNSALGLGLAIAGGAAVATGVVLLYLNRARTVIPEVAPLPGGAAVSWHGSF